MVSPQARYHRRFYIKIQHYTVNFPAACYNKSMPVTIESITKPDLQTSRSQPLFIAEIPAGFPSPAEDYKQESLDLNRHLIKNPASTYFVKVSGDSMVKAGIHPGDLLVVDRSLEAADKKIVIANINGELTVKRIRIFSSRVVLEPENDNYQPQELTEGEDLQIWGVVTNVIHQL